MNRLRELYDNEITKEMTEKFGYKNPMMIPKLDKIVITYHIVYAAETFRYITM